MTILAYYVSGHGFGHAVRSAEVIRALQRRRPGLDVHLRTTAPAWLFPPVASCRAVELDVGVVQPDALRTDAAATLARAGALAERMDELVAAEVRFLREAGAELVVGDIPPPAFPAARRAGVPGVAVTNFSWDWIYQSYVERAPRYRWLLDMLGEAYRQAELLLRLPFHGDLSAFPAIEDVPLITRPPSAPRGVLRERFGLRPDERAVLLSFAGHGLQGLEASSLGALPAYTFIASERELSTTSALPPNVRLAPLNLPNYTDLVAASDAVVSKPGFGIVALCLAERVPLLYTERGDFAEYPILVEGIQRWGRGRFIPRADLLAGDLGPHLDALFKIEQPAETPRTDGAEVVAGRLLEIVDRARRARSHSHSSCSTTSARLRQG